MADGMRAIRRKPKALDRPQCWLAQFGPGDCAGEMDRAHLIPAQVIRREVSREFPILWDPRVWRPACRWHHGQLDARRYHLRREDLPESVEEYAEQHGLVWRLDRDYGMRRDAA